MFLVASEADAVSDREVTSGFKECERNNGFKPWIRKMQSNAEKIQCTFCRCEIRTHRSDINSYDASNERQCNAVPHYAMRQNGD